MNAIKLAYKAGFLASPWQWVGAGLHIDLTLHTLVHWVIADGVFARRGGAGAASTSLMSANISKEDAGAWALTVILKIKRCDLVKMDALLLCPLGAAELHTARHIKSGSLLFKASAAAADIRGAPGALRVAFN